MSGFVYCMTNPCFKEALVKVGMSNKSVSERKQSLSACTSVPTSFVCEFYIEVSSTETIKTESKIHKDLVNAGFKKQKEFFHCTPAQTLEIFKEYGTIHYEKYKTPEKAIEHKIITRKKFAKIIKNANLTKIITHTKDETGEHVHNCSACDYTTNRRLNIDRHIESKKHKKNIIKFAESGPKQNVKKNGTKKFGDDIVNEIKDELKNEIRKELLNELSAESKIVLKQGKYDCKYCNKKFKHASSMYRHIKKCEYAQPNASPYDLMILELQNKLNKAKLEIETYKKK